MSAGRLYCTRGLDGEGPAGFTVVLRTDGGVEATRLRPVRLTYVLALYLACVSALVLLTDLLPGESSSWILEKSALLLIGRE